MIKEGVKYTKLFKNPQAVFFFLMKCMELFLADKKQLRMSSERNHFSVCCLIKGKIMQCSFNLKYQLHLKIYFPKQFIQKL